MDLLGTNGGGSFKRGDAVQEITPTGLLLMQGVRYVLDMYNDRMELSRILGGDPILGVDNKPIHFPVRNFRMFPTAA